MSFAISSNINSSINITCNKCGLSGYIIQEINTNIFLLHPFYRCFYIYKFFNTQDALINITFLNQSLFLTYFSNKIETYFGSLRCAGNDYFVLTIQTYVYFNAFRLVEGEINSHIPICYIILFAGQLLFPVILLQSVDLSATTSIISNSIYTLYNINIKAITEDGIYTNIFYEKGVHVATLRIHREFINCFIQTDLILYLITSISSLFNIYIIDILSKSVNINLDIENLLTIIQLRECSFISYSFFINIPMQFIKKYDFLERGIYLMNTLFVNFVKYIFTCRGIVVNKSVLFFTLSNITYFIEELAGKHLHGYVSLSLKIYCDIYSSNSLLRNMIGLPSIQIECLPNIFCLFLNKVYFISKSYSIYSIYSYKQMPPKIILCSNVMHNRVLSLDINTIPNFKAKFYKSAINGVFCVRQNRVKGKVKIIDYTNCNINIKLKTIKMNEFFIHRIRGFFNV